jgi:hypothetical protein
LYLNSRLVVVIQPSDRHWSIISKLDTFQTLQNATGNNGDTRRAWSVKTIADAAVMTVAD